MMLRSQRLLPTAVFQALDAALGYEPSGDRFGKSDTGWLRASKVGTGGILTARATVTAIGWRNIAGLSEQAREDRDLEDSFIEIATRLPIEFLAARAGCEIHYDTRGFARGDNGDYSWEYVLRGTT